MQHGSPLFDAPQKTNNFSLGDFTTGAPMILNEPGEFSENTDEQDPVASANRGLEYHEYLEIFLNPTVQHNVAKSILKNTLN